MQLFQTNIFFNLLSVILGTHPWPLSICSDFVSFSQPEIPKFGKGMPSNPTPQGANEKDFISYTVSAPSGRGTAMFSADGRLNAFRYHVSVAF